MPDIFEHRLFAQLAGPRFGWPSLLSTLLLLQWTPRSQQHKVATKKGGRQIQTASIWDLKCYRLLKEGISHAN